MADLASKVKGWARELGFQDAGISNIDLGQHEQHLKNWLDKHFHGEMDYMTSHGNKRSRPGELVPGTIRVICVRMDYLPGDTQTVRILKSPEKAYISRYSLGRDYHKVIRKRLTQLGKRIEEEVGSFGYRAFVDSAPVLEKALAQQAGLGWIGKNTLLLNNKAGSWFFLGELFTDLPLPVDKPVTAMRCGSCFACKKICPTDAIIGSHQLDARRCISYLTIELKDSIPLEFRKAIGNRVFGCDDCQIICPWNKFAKPTGETDFLPRHKLDSSELADLFLWTEEEFLERTAGSPIRRTGFEGWLRNLAVGLGNAPSTEKVIHALEARLDYPSDMVQEHVRWALEQHQN
ncbi:tRNA epoxyqueuosine(34) reductase QueG [Sansalvadorimonas sp. 2012CJ34-2]|uniref:Epoxyqueuosine reductase n=1 Tax=Parendozoicomonas callyspongiae TaxID=2942213 RepID=A0ABT0PMK1_9GAMM|nr:tRNA epoxyqueuosine(34) reductase QueG [Sansalvadorimonas sp. 2012CJ34-2]MCL6271972.1 tRNA epoxyqueuosine(34) reductase QueG [Sansalvadorimonas sp. 2012CJ34-2]